jgi:hypothetical protein
MAMIPYMAAGYVADRAMGGNGMTGLAIGTGVGGFGTGAFAGALGSGAAGTTTAGMTNAVAANAATNTMPLLMTNSAAAGGSGLGALGGAGMYEGAALGSVNPLTTGGFSESISPFTQLGGAGVGGNVGFLGQPISNQVMNSSLTGEKGLLGYGLENTMIGDGFNSLTGTINDGYENMSFMDKVGTAQMGGQVIDATNQPPPQLQVRPPQSIPAKEPTISSPLAINVQAPNTTFVKDPRKLYEERYGYA